FALFREPAVAGIFAEQHFLDLGVRFDVGDRYRIIFSFLLDAVLFAVIAHHDCTGFARGALGGLQLFGEIETHHSPIRRSDARPRAHAARPGSSGAQVAAPHAWSPRPAAELFPDGGSSEARRQSVASAGAARR